MGIVRTNETGLVFTGVVVDNEKNAVVLDGCSRVRFLRCRFTNSKAGAVWLIGCQDVEMVECVIQGAGDPVRHADDCITSKHCSNLRILRCDISGGAHSGLSILDWEGGYCEIVGNYFHDMHGSLIVLKRGVHQALVMSNRLHGAPDADHSPSVHRVHHAAIQLSGDDHVLRGNVVEACGKGFLLSCSTSRADSPIQTCNGTLISGNRFDRITGHAIELQGYSAEMRGALNGTQILDNQFGQIGGDRVHRATPGGDWGTIERGSTGLGGTPTSPPVEPPPPPPVTPPPVTPPAPPTVGLPLPGTPEHLALRKDLVRVLNIKRAEAGAPPVAEHPLLSASAQLYCERMSREGFFGHEAPTEPSSIRERIEAAGYKGNLVGEVLSQAFSRDTAEEQIGAWMNSPPHRAILLDRRYTEAGFGQFAAYWCGQFGLRPGTTPTPQPPPVDPPPVTPPTPPPVTPPTPQPPPVTPPVGGGRYRPRAKAVIEAALKGLRYNPLSASRWEMLEEGIAAEMERAHAEGKADG